MIEVLHGSRETALPHATADGDALWMDGPDVERATGWAWKPEGLCRDDTCMPLPRATEPPVVVRSRLDIAALWRHAGWPVEHDGASSLWVLGEGASRRADSHAPLASLEAPDFELPDVDGRRRRLSDFRGRRVFLATWASW